MLHTATSALLCADDVTSAVASLLPGRGYEPHSGKSGDDRPHEEETTQPDRIHDHAGWYRLQWPPVRSGVPVYGSAPSRVRTSKRYCRRRQSGELAGPSLPELRARRPVQLFHQAGAYLSVRPIFRHGSDPPARLPWKLSHRNQKYPAPDQMSL